MKYLLILLSLNCFALEKVAILDTGLDLNDKRFAKYLCKEGHKDFTGKGIEDHHGHGTHIFGLVTHEMNTKKYCVVILKFFDKEESVTYSAYVKSVNYIRVLNPKIVNLSLEGYEYSQEEFDMINTMPKTTFVAAAGNKGLMISNKVMVYPAGFKMKNIVAVGSSDFNSNFGIPNMKYEHGRKISSFAIGSGYTLMTGSSQSTAIYTGKLVK